MKPNVLISLFVALGAMCSFARVVEDSKSRFVLDDVVVETSVHPCDSAGLPGAKFLPERVTYLDGHDMPYRYYWVALPSNQKPAVSITDSKTVPLGKPLCAEHHDIRTDSAWIYSVNVSDPVLRDGLWMTQIRVPLYVRNGASVSLRKNFRLKVQFNGSANGVNPGKRALSRVENPVAASRFGASKAKAIRALRSEAAGGDLPTFIARFRVGDQNVANNSEDGLYAVSYSAIRNAMPNSKDLDGIPVDWLRVYGASPDSLADMGPGTSERVPNHIFEIPIEVRDHTPAGRGFSASSNPDGLFNESDSIIFVGYGNSFWKRCDSEDKMFLNGKMDYFHSYSPYSFYQKFLLGYSESGKGLRFSQKVNAPSGNGKEVAWMRYVRAEQDLILRDTYFGKELDWEKASGKEWFWHWHSRLDTTSVSFGDNETVRLPGLVEGGKQYLAVSYFPHRSLWASSAVVVGDQVAEEFFSGYSYKTRMDSINFAMEVNGVRVDRSEMTLMPGGNFRMDNPGLVADGNQYRLEMLPNIRQFDRFDGYTVAYQWNPVVDSAEWLLPGASVAGVINVPVPSNTKVLKFSNLRPVGFLTASGNSAKDSVSADEDVRYLAVREDVYRPNLVVEGIPNYGEGVLRDLSRPNSKLEYLIITPAEFVEQAKALAEFRNDGSSVGTFATSVVVAEDIYDRYTAGRMSPVAIRNYIAYVYSVCPNFRYVLLAGAGHFDYRDINKKYGVPYIPPFEKEDVVLEDFFGVLDSGEVMPYGSYDVDVSVGRLPVATTTEFANYITKAKDYEKKGSMDYSEWRSTLLHAADDAKNSGSKDYTKHTKYQEDLVNLIDSLAVYRNERWNFKKVYLLDYPEDAAGLKKSAAVEFVNLLNQGALFTTYFGHCSKTDWASEGLLKPSYLAKLSNKSRYTILGSFSCTVGRFDEGDSRSLSEEFVVAPKVGSIASIGATRETFAENNSAFGKNLLVNALTVNGETIGMAMLKTKRLVSLNYSKQRYNDGRYVLLGEPVIRMPSSDLKVSLNKSLDSIKALDRMSLSGTVEGMDDGFVNLELREGRSVKRMALNVADDSINVFYDGGLIYSEKIPVKGGKFSTEFVTPRKISIGDTAAEFSAWAYTSNTSSVGRSWIRNILISGVSDYAESLNDTVPPTIQIQSCYASGTATDFAEGETVKLQSPACLQVVVEDATALDFREQADEGISFEVSGVQEPFHPWPYLEQTSKRAKLRMNFSTEQYPAGNYIFRVYANDVLGNMSTKMINVEITDDMESGLADVFNAPNPVGKKGTTFYFKNLAVDRDSKVDIFIYNQNGKLVRVIKDAVSGVTHWNGHDNHGRLLANGLYHYVVRSTVSATENFGKKTWTKKQKLLISR